MKMLLLQHRVIYFTMLTMIVLLFGLMMLLAGLAKLAQVYMIFNLFCFLEVHFSVIIVKWKVLLIRQLLAGRIILVIRELKLYQLEKPLHLIILAGRQKLFQMIMCLGLVCLLEMVYLLVH